MTGKIIVSACLMGMNVRYDGTLVTIHDLLREWDALNRIVAFCPEVAGGLTVPRVPAEILGGDGFSVIGGKATVVSRDGKDVTDNFLKGALKALETAENNDITIAILKDGSPSCGSTYVYDGSFTKTRVAGKGVTAALLEQNGIRIYTEQQMMVIPEK